MRPLLSVLLWPASFFYGLIVRFRNHLYNIDYKKSFSFDINVISVGNLSVGGNGKTPMVEYLIRLLGEDHKVAVLSRGYGRRTRGFMLANTSHTAADIGDEPLQMFLKYQPQLTVAVGESRAQAIPSILYEHPDIQTIILDDAFQHRAVKPKFSILVTDFRTPFFNDSLLPSGRLREPRKGVERADVVVVTKCPPGMGADLRRQYINQIHKYHQEAPVFFSCIQYLDPVHFITGDTPADDSEVLLVSGIAKSEPLEQYVSSCFKLVEHARFRDHYRYSERDINNFMQRLENLTSDRKIILTTEKDMVRLLEFRDKLQGLPLYYLPIECSFIEMKAAFDKTVLNSL